MNREIHNYRFYCQTESNNVTSWSQTTPTTCPNNAAHVIDTSSIAITDTIATNDVFVNNVTRCPFGQWRTTEKSLVIELKSCFGKSRLRDVEFIQGNATITNDVGDTEYRLTTTSSNDAAVLYSAERGRYISGIGAEVGLGVRITGSTASNVTYCWGLYDSSNGFYYKYNSNGLHVCVKRDGIEQSIHSSQFNGELAATNYNWEPNDGHIYNIVFSWYGYGAVTFTVQHKPNITKPFIRLHTFETFYQTSTKNPNLPITAEVRNNGTTANGEIYVAGRQYSVLGKYIPIYRLNSAYRAAVPVNSTTTFLPILTLRRKAGFNGVAVKLSTVDFNATSTMYVQFRMGTTLTGASFTNLPDQQSNETVMEYDQSATATTGGVVIWTGIISADRSGVQQLSDFTYVLTEYENLTLCAKGVSATNGNLTTCIRVNEEW